MSAAAWSVFLFFAPVWSGALMWVFGRVLPKFAGIPSRWHDGKLYHWWGGTWHDWGDSIERRDRESLRETLAREAAAKGSAQYVGAHGLNPYAWQDSAAHHEAAQSVGPRGYLYGGTFAGVAAAAWLGHRDRHAARVAAANAENERQRRLVELRALASELSR